MSTVDTSTWNPDPALNESIGDIPLNESASIKQTWQAIQMLMAAGGLHGLQLVTFDGATASADGKQGLVPAPEAGEQDKFLKGDGTWDDVPVPNLGTASRAVQTDADGILAVSSVTATELGYLSGVTSALQTQIDAKAADSAVVHNTGNEVVAGTKIFSSPVTVKEASDTPYLHLQREDLDLAQSNSSNLYANIDFLDKNDSLVSMHSFVRFTQSAAIRIRAFSKASSGNTAELTVRAFDTGVNWIIAYCTAIPGTSNAYSLGDSSHLWNVVYAATGQINTSDERLKDNIEEIPDDVLDAWGEVDWVQYQFKDSISKKGINASLHSGLIAQRIAAAFKSRGIDATRYGLFCYDKWDASGEELNEDGSVALSAREAGDRYSLRYEEALAMEAAYQRRRADRLESRVKALEERLNG